MKKFLPIAGLMAVWILTPGFWLLPRQAHAGLYDDVRSAVEKETDPYRIEGDVKEFVAQTLRSRKTLWDEAQAGDVDLALRGDIAKLCKGRKVNKQGDCLAYAQAVSALARQEQSLRAFGRDLQALASRDELPVEGLRASTTDFALHQAAILNVWRTSGGTADINPGGTASPAFRGLGLAEGALNGALSDLRSALESLSEEQRTAAVWRYRHGVRFKTNERKPSFPAPTVDATLTDTERQYLLGSWPGVEAALESVWVTIRSQSEVMSLQPGEYAVLLSSDAAVKGKLPKNVLLWGIVDGNTSQNFPMGDVGLLWEIPMDPVLPSLNKQSGGPIPGGAFPPNAEDGHGLCGHPLAGLGYLCRPISGVASDVCREDPTQNTTAITLTSCTEKQTEQDQLLARSLAGPDACEDVAWYDADPAAEEFQCSLAAACSSACADSSGTPNPEERVHVYEKTADGKVSICIHDGSNVNTLSPRYNLATALVIADQVCNGPPFGTPFNDPDIDCCRIFGEANRSACTLMAEDGILENGDISSDGIPFTIETCTEALTLEACQANELGACPTSRDYDPTGEGSFMEELVARARSATQGESCNDALGGNIDPRNLAAFAAIDRRDDISRPGRTITYRNSIGNHLCAAGSYLEELWERRQRTGGSVPYTIFDRKSPWLTTGLSDPAPGDVTSTILQPLTSAAQVGGSLRAYRPALLARAFDIELCQQSGLPPRVPPERCLLEQRRFIFPLKQFLNTFDRSVVERTDERQAIRDAQQGAAAVGTHIGNEQYARYVRTGIRSLTDMLRAATEALEHLRLQSSPGRMCPSLPVPQLSEGSALSVPAMSAMSASVSSAQ